LLDEGEEITMKVYTVLAIYQGVPDTIETYTEIGLARTRGRELASQLDIMSRPPGWERSEGRWNPQRGSTRAWRHHWYNDEHDVVVAECDLREVPASASQ
jgi:hypothetical protein